MPRQPHVGFQATDRLLEDFFDERAGAPRARRAGPPGLVQRRTPAPRSATRRSCGSATSAPRRPWTSSARWASRSSARWASTAARTTRDRLRGHPRAGNGLPSFDAQFWEIEAIVRDRGIDYDPLVEPLRVFVGVDDSQMVAARVLEYTIRKHASCPVRFIPMIDVPTPAAEGPGEPRAHRLLLQPLPHPAAGGLPRAGPSTWTPTCRCSPTSRSC